MCKLTARHGRGTEWARHGHGMLCVNRLSACRIPISATNALLGRQILRHPCMTGSQTTRRSFRFEFNTIPWLMSQEEAPRMTGITRFKTVNFIFSAVFPSNTVWPMSTSKRRLSLKMLRDDRQKHRNYSIKSDVDYGAFQGSLSTSL